MSRILVALIACTVASSASAQLVTFTSRTGAAIAYCGPPGTGPFVQHDFSNLSATNDAVSVSDPGGPTWSPSTGAAQLDTAPSSSGISIAVSGSSSRSSSQFGGAYATGDSRDSWNFTLSAPTRFTMSASLSASSTEATTPTQAYNLLVNGGGAQIIPDPGTPTGAFTGAISAPGSFSITATGTLTPGQYFVSLFGRSEGNSFPFNGSFSNSFTLTLGCGVTSSYCTPGTTTHGCTAHIGATGTPSVSASSGFTLGVTGMEGASQGLFFYGISGRAAAPWGASSSFVCVKSPTQRTGAQNGGGTAGACNGALSLDWNAFVASHPGSLGAPFSVGQLVQAQGWFRDPPSPKSTMLSDALEFAVCP